MIQFQDGKKMIIFLFINSLSISRILANLSIRVKIANISKVSFKKIANNLPKEKPHNR
jgi:hypothetical protein